MEPKDDQSYLPFDDAFLESLFRGVGYGFADSLRNYVTTPGPRDPLDRFDLLQAGDERMLRSIYELARINLKGMTGAVLAEKHFASFPAAFRRGITGRLGEHTISEIGAQISYDSEEDAWGWEAVDPENGRPYKRGGYLTAHDAAAGAWMTLAAARAVQNARGK